jgi:hypothetical protein
MSFTIKSFSPNDNYDSLINPIQLATSSGTLKTILINNGLLYNMRTLQNINIGSLVVKQLFPPITIPDSTKSNNVLSLSNILIISIVIPIATLLILFFILSYYKQYFKESKRLEPVETEIDLRLDNIYDYSPEIPQNIQNDMRIANNINSTVDDGLVPYDFLDYNEIGFANVDSIYYNNEEKKSTNEAKSSNKIDDLSKEDKMEGANLNISIQAIYGTSSDEEFFCRNPLRVVVDTDHIAYI